MKTFYQRNKKEVKEFVQVSEQLLLPCRKSGKLTVLGLQRIDSKIEYSTLHIGRKFEILSLSLLS